MMQTAARDWTKAELPISHDDSAEAVPLHQLRAAASRAQRDRMVLILLAFFAAALAFSAL